MSAALAVRVQVEDIVFSLNDYTRIERRAKEMEQRAKEIRDERGREYFTRLYGVSPESASTAITRDTERATALKLELATQTERLNERKIAVERALRETQGNTREGKTREGKTSVRSFLRGR